MNVFLYITKEKSIKGYEQKISFHFCEKPNFFMGSAMAVDLTLPTDAVSTCHLSTIISNIEGQLYHERKLIQR
jgi:hypothetical protein